jgi:hypothetical protein
LRDFARGGVVDVTYGFSPRRLGGIFMVIVLRLTVACLVLGLVGSALAGPPHTPRWTPRTAAPGTIVTIAGTGAALGP